MAARSRTCQPQLQHQRGGGGVEQRHDPAALGGLKGRAAHAVPHQQQIHPQVEPKGEQAAAKQGRVLGALVAGAVARPAAGGGCPHEQDEDPGGVEQRRQARGDGHDVCVGWSCVIA